MGSIHQLVMVMLVVVMVMMQIEMTQGSPLTRQSDGETHDHNHDVAQTENATEELYCKDSTGGAVMQKGFQYARGEDKVCMLFLFEGQILNTETKYRAAAFAVFVMGVCNEIFMLLRKRAADYFSDKQSTVSQKVVARSVIGSLYGAQMTNAYFMMLVVMVYETTMFACLVVGLAVGHAVVPMFDQTKSSSDSSGKEKLLADGTSPCCGGSGVQGSS